MKKKIYEEVRLLENKARSIHMDKSLIPTDGLTGVYSDYSHRNGAVYEEFKKLVFVNSEFSSIERGRAMFEEVFSKAWEDGHRSGYFEVYNHFISLERLTMNVLNIALSG